MYSDETEEAFCRADFFDVLSGEMDMDGKQQGLSTKASILRLRVAEGFKNRLYHLF